MLDETGCCRVLAHSHDGLGVVRWTKEFPTEQSTSTLSLESRVALISGLVIKNMRYFITIRNPFTAILRGPTPRNQKAGDRLKNGME